MSETMEAMPAAPSTFAPTVISAAAVPAFRIIAIDLDGTLIGADGVISPVSAAALNAALEAGVEIVIATGRRHSYALKVLRALRLPEHLSLISSNGAVVRTMASELVETTLMDTAAARWLCGHLGAYRNALVITFDRVGRDGEDTRGALVVEQLADLHSSIDRWMTANEPYIAVIDPIEQCLEGEAPIQMMLCGACVRMRTAEALMLTDARVAGVGESHAGTKISLNRTEYPERNLSIVDILPAGCSKGAALLRLAAARGVGAEQIMAIGDNWNDVSMLEVAGRAVLMANAPEDLLETVAGRGWRLTATNEQDGVAQAILGMLAEQKD